jgi:sulfotransferase
MRTVHFLSGMPRSGSTLLANLLAQNPRFHATATSGILEVMFQTRNLWQNVDALKAMDEAESERCKVQVLRGIILGYFEHVDKPVVFDKSRGWLAYMEMAEAVLGRRPRVIVTVRDLRDILASFEKLFRKTSATRQVTQEAAAFHQFQTVAGRCDMLCRNDQLVGSSFNRVKDAVHRGWRDCMLFVEYERLTATPGSVMREVYEFLGEEPFEHDFNNVEQVTQEDDLVHIWKDLHKIRQKIEPQQPQWPSILTKEASDKYADDARFWTRL